MGVKLSDLAREFDSLGWLVSCSGEAEVGDVHLDSRVAMDESLFCCLEGEVHDGHDFADAAILNGAVALLATRALPSVAVPTIIVKGEFARKATAVAACRVHGDPSHLVPVVGVTGTNGKTTTVAMLSAICTAAGLQPEVFGTLSGTRTTAEAPDLQRAMRRAIDAGRTIILMEVTSHALVLERTHGIRFRATVFTNLGHDHLDFHGSLEAYFEAKARLFAPEIGADAIVNEDDPYGQILIDRIARSGRANLTHAYGIADATGIVETMSSSSFSWRGSQVVVPIGGRHNTYNALAAATAASALGIDDSSIVRGLATLGPVPGRLERVADDPFAVYVDYAHTPDSLRAVLSAARATMSAGGRLIVVFGCGGDRDRTKRPMMGAVAGEIADLVIVTTDNPRSEDPSAIAAQIVEGMAEATSHQVVLDRREAIATAVSIAQSGDVVVIAGKGHERGQVLATVTLDFDDVEEALAALGRRSAGLGGESIPKFKREGGGS